MIEEIISELTTELTITDPHLFNETLLRAKVNSAYRDVKRARNYPSDFTAQSIEEDMRNYYSNILNIARYDYNQIGAEGQRSYHEDGVTIHYLDRNELFFGILPIARKA